MGGGAQGAPFVFLRTGNTTGALRDVRIGVEGLGHARVPHCVHPQITTPEHLRRSSNSPSRFQSIAIVQVVGIFAYSPTPHFELILGFENSVPSSRKVTLQSIRSSLWR